jgi:hypothetical protein
MELKELKDSFFDTIGIKESDPQLHMEFTERNDRQNEVVLSVFKSHPDTAFTPYEIETVLKSMGYSFLITSIRRAINTLTNGIKSKKTGEWKLKPVLKKLETQVTEKYKTPNHKWQLL